MLTLISWMLDQLCLKLVCGQVGSLGYYWSCRHLQTLRHAPLSCWVRRSSAGYICGFKELHKVLRKSLSGSRARFVSRVKPKSTMIFLIFRLNRGNKTALSGLGRDRGLGLNNNLTFSLTRHTNSSWSSERKLFPRTETDLTNVKHQHKWTWWQK